jgi:hypothetical protein
MRSGAPQAHGSLLANSTFEGTFYFSQAPKMADIPHREEKNDLFCGISPHFLNSPTISLSGGSLTIEFDKVASVCYGKSFRPLGVG